MSNMMSTFTDCPGREKLAYPADYLQPFGALHRHFGYAAYLRTMERHLAEGQSKAGDNIGNVALKAPVYDWGYTGRFGDEINWGNGIILVPWFLYETYGDTQTMARYYPQMQAFVNYIRTQGGTARTPTSSTPRWRLVGAETTSGRITGTWGYHQIADRMSKMAALLGHDADAGEYRELAAAIKDAFNDAFYNSALGRYTSEGNARHHRRDAGRPGTRARRGAGPRRRAPTRPRRARRADQRIPAVRRRSALQRRHHRAGADRARADGRWPRRRPVEGAAGGHPAELRLLHGPDDREPRGPDHLPEQWDMGDSKNHMILLQVEEWFHARPGRYPAGARLLRLPRAGDRPAGRRRPHPRRGQLPDARTARSHRSGPLRTAPSG